MNVTPYFVAGLSFNFLLTYPLSSTFASYFRPAPPPALYDDEFGIASQFLVKSIESNSR